MLSGNVIATSGFAISNAFSDYDVKTGNFNEWLVQRVKMGIVKVTWGSGDTVTSADGMNISGYVEKAMNFTTVQAASVFDTNAVLDPYVVQYDKVAYKLAFYGALSGTVHANTGLVAVASGQLSLASAVVYLQVFGT
jgi:hypothetical protein